MYPPGAEAYDKMSAKSVRYKYDKMNSKGKHT